MLAILFPHMFFPSDYMDEDVLLEDSTTLEGSQLWDETNYSIRQRIADNSNAEAGPSRLH
jgi:hypothetical protein